MRRECMEEVLLAAVDLVVVIRRLDSLLQVENLLTDYLRHLLHCPEGNRARHGA